MKRTVTNTFDGDGNLRRRAVNGTGAESRDYTVAVDGGGFELTLAGVVTSSSVDGPEGGLLTYNGVPAAATAGDYQYVNAHGDVVTTMSTAGVQGAVEGYDPFGGSETPQAADTAQDKWLGRWHKKTDQSLTLVQLGARQYDLTTGRFLTVDPVDGGSLNNYEYAGHDPINQYDLDGECWHWVCGTAKTIGSAIKNGSAWVAKKSWHYVKKCAYGWIGAYALETGWQMVRDIHTGKRLFRQTLRYVWKAKSSWGVTGCVGAMVFS